jgi:putative DNA primase/helicase
MNNYPDKLTAALHYAKLGWKVFPVWWVKDGKCACGEADCENPGKHPLGKLAPNGRNSATRDQITILKWWKKFPAANIGIATGKESGLVVVDVDPRHGGNESKKKMEKLGNFPITPTTYTGGGGEHILMAHPCNGVKIKSRPLPGYPGIDIKADGGYIVAPPSNHISGGVYSWKIPPNSTR